MEIHQIRYFLALCKQRTFTAAAIACGVSQPSLTIAIKALEQELGGKLFRRGASRTDLTALGLAIRPHFRRLMRSYEHARQEAAGQLNGIHQPWSKRGGSYAEVRKRSHCSQPRSSGGNGLSQAVHAATRRGSLGPSTHHLD